VSIQGKKNTDVLTGSCNYDEFENEQNPARVHISERITILLHPYMTLINLTLKIKGLFLAIPKCLYIDFDVCVKARGEDKFHPSRFAPHVMMAKICGS